ncbi:MAG: quinol:cytochrome C oxidoreductase [Deltaproteobacteria bacterium]|nr:quinol:cytochrome C oxidoreductase [Deltaproteobacteria bacterium]
MSHAEVTKPSDITIPANSLWAKLPMIGGALAVVGLGATLATGTGEHGARSMFAYLWAFEVVLALSLGAIGWVMIDHAVRSQWSIVVRRIGETAAAVAPLFIVLFIPIATIGFHSLYPWSHETDPVLEKKRWFLSDGFFFGRAAFYLLAWSALGWFLHSSSVKQDKLAGDLVERNRITRTLWKVSAVGIFVWALTQSFQAIDWLMSLQPHWYSTIFGVYFFAASILAFFAFMTLVAMGLQNAGLLKHAITTEHFHDLGKLIFGFTIFWAYIAFSQFILIWYANLPEETEFYLVRLEGGWSAVSYFLPIGHFFVPFFFLLSRHMKRRRSTLAIGCVWILLMHAMDIYWLVLPNFGGHGEHSHFAPSWVDGAALVGMAGAFLAAFGMVLKKNSVICINEPRLEDSLVHENF